jgi:hypothetical protein
VLAIQTSNPLSAKRNTRDCLGGSNNHVTPSYINTPTLHYFPTSSTATKGYAKTYFP